MRKKTNSQRTVARRTAHGWDRTVADLEGQLRVGNLDAARNELATNQGGGKHLIQAAPDETSRMHATLLVCEVLFAFGDDVAAQRWLKPYAEQPAQVLTSTLSARRKLQLAEYHYSLFQINEAQEIAQSIFDNLKKTPSPLDLGECRYYLARFCLRQNEHRQASEHCMAGLVIFHRARVAKGTDDGDNSLRWQTGRLLRVRGTALWWMGRLSEASAVLYLAAWLLDQGSRIYVGDAFHALGRLLRSLGPERYDEAQEAFDHAQRNYQGHDLKLARALTDLARTLQNMGLDAIRRRDTKQAERQFEASKTYLDQALKLGERHGGSEASVIWQRQTLDALIWRSWFYQEAEGFRDPSKAREAAAQAIELAAVALPEQSPERVEAALALGHCELAEGRDQAIALLTEAQRLADDLKIPKLQFHAHLSLAEWACRIGRDPQAAQAHFDTARALLPGQEFDGYLREKADKVRNDIGELVRTTDRFVFSKEDLFRGEIPAGWNRVKMLRSQAEKWAVETAEREAGSANEAATKLDVSIGTIRGIRRRYDALLKGEPPPAE